VCNNNKKNKQNIEQEAAANKKVPTTTLTPIGKQKTNRIFITHLSLSLSSIILTT
jgi:hypothetical protein